MAESFLLLRAVRGIHTAGPFGRPRLLADRTESRADGPPQVALDQARLTASELRSVARDPEIAAIARSMPTALIRPVASPAQPGPAQAAPTWGIRAIGADTSPMDGASVAVAVLDTGIDAAHPAFQGVGLEQRDFSGSGDGDVQGHGTHCAGTIFGRDVDGVRIGVARGVTRALIGKVLDDEGGGQSEWLFRGMNWAFEQGAQVVSMSLGFDFPGFVKQLVGQGWPIELATSQALQDYRANIAMFDALMEIAEARQAFGTGTVVVAASGNESRADSDPPFRIAVSVPAAARHVLSIGAAGEGSRGGGGFVIAPFSNTQPELAAPGVNVVSAKAGGGLVAFNGTSMATPHAAGAAALWWQALPGLGARRLASVVRARLLAEARPLVFDPGVELADRGEGMVSAPPATTPPAVA